MLVGAPSMPLRRLKSEKRTTNILVPELIRRLLICWLIQGLARWKFLGLAKSNTIIVEGNTSNL
jgi:hypothetical protein